MSLVDPFRCKCDANRNTKQLLALKGENMRSLAIVLKLVAPIFFIAGALLIWLAIILIISTLASILPARNATRISVRESLAYV